MTKYLAQMFVLIAGAVAAGCTMANVEPPPLSGPSEMSLSLAITANPDVLSLDGSSQTLVTVEARDTNGQLVPNVPLRVDIRANGQVTDFGSISARTLVTGSNGRATFTYTAPPFTTGPIPDLQLSVTPTGTDASAHLGRVVTVRLVHPNVIGEAPTARFTFVPNAPAAFTDVRFDGSTSTPGLGAVITSYVWDFGDGSTGTGVTATHQYDAAGTYLVRLTVTDNRGLSHRSDAQLITVGAGAPPTAAFLFSPEAPTTCDSVFFNANVSQPGTGHRIVSYNWSWGDGTPAQSGSIRSHRFTREGVWAVLLTVTDEAGQRATSSQSISVIAGPNPCP
jgi:PKD repeat protein